MAASIHLDTNFLIYYIGGGNERVIAHVEQWVLDGTFIYASAMAWAEFQCGPLPSADQAAAEELLQAILPVNTVIAARAGDLFRKTGRRSRSLPDCLIAATAMIERAPLATNNRADFEPFVAHGLLLCAT